MIVRRVFLVIRISVYRYEDSGLLVEVNNNLTTQYLHRPIRVLSTERKLTTGIGAGGNSVGSLPRGGRT